MNIRKILCAFVVAICTAGTVAQAAPQVVVSIKPVHSLVAGVMAGIGKPTLIIDGTASPHRYRLKPSQAQAIAQADLVFWIGPELESFLRKPIAQLAKSANAVALLAQAGIKPLQIREDREQAHEHNDAHHDHNNHKDGHDDHAQSDSDPHIWLDPENAILMVNAITDALVAVDAQNTAQYQKNAGELTRKLTALTQETSAKFASVKGRPFLVFHDSYQYFEKRFGLLSLGAILDRPDVPASAKRISEVRKLLGDQSKPTCVFTEPQFNDGLAVAVASAGQSTIKTLDPLGTSLAAGPGHYFDTIVAIRDALVQCFETTR